MSFRWITWVEVISIFVVRVWMWNKGERCNRKEILAILLLCWQTLFARPGTRCTVSLFHRHCRHLRVHFSLCLCVCVCVALSFSLSFPCRCSTHLRRGEAGALQQTFTFTFTHTRTLTFTVAVHASLHPTTWRWRLLCLKLSIKCGKDVLVDSDCKKKCHAWNKDKVLFPD